jgi:preprotein translocase subunit SecG
MISKIISISLPILAVLLIILVLIQQKGSGLGSLFGGDDTVYRTKRGAEKVIFIATIVIAVLFFGLATANLFIGK